MSSETRCALVYKQFARAANGSREHITCNTRAKVKLWMSAVVATKENFMESYRSFEIMQFSLHWIELCFTVKPLTLDTLKSGHLVLPQIHTNVYKIIPEIRKPLKSGHLLWSQWCPE